MSKKKAVTCKDAVAVDEILDMTKRTAKNLNRWKKQGITTKVITIKALLTYCDKIDSLCKRIKELEGKQSITKKEFRKGWKHFCSCINFNQSNLDAKAIQFMNEAPGKIIESLS